MVRLLLHGGLAWTDSKEASGQTVYVIAEGINCENSSEQGGSCITLSDLVPEATLLSSFG